MRYYIHHNESWWSRPEGGSQVPGDGAIDEVMILNEDGHGEVIIRWFDLQGEQVPRLEMFDDAWGLLREWTELFVSLGDFWNSRPTPEEIMDWLEEHGFTDGTPRKSPYAVD